ncbi:MAG: bifunctional acetate--CoA ligase family protein/GNAT family N-acetyltransferase [Gammaproteobacteria bacterium]|nr:bifunctional acetate--CoA ligase family protein/GNAT family N-acetyltransferase [Gammaproteobacteria bacterium]
MTQHYLSPFFSAQAVAIIGASTKEGSVGHRLLYNMIEAGYKGRLYPVNPRYEEILGKACYPEIGAVPDQVEMAVIATPAATVPDILRACGEKNIRNVVVISAGFSEAGAGKQGQLLEKEMLEVARRYGIRIIGPNCLGIMRPSKGINATFGYDSAHPGKLALVSQSGAICTAILDWAKSQGIGFSTVVSIGDASDIDFGEVLDYLAMDPQTTSILLYVEGLNDARAFLSGLKAAARIKPVILIKSGRHEASSKAAMSHTGAMVGGDDVFDAAIERTGVVRVYTISHLFSAARILSANTSFRGSRLAIVTNAGGPGVMATDRAEDLGVSLVNLSEETINKMDEVLPAHWSRANPVDILGDADPNRYADAVRICLEDRSVDGVLIILTPQATTEPTKVAEQVIEAVIKTHKPILAAWTGGDRVQEARGLFAKAGIPHFNTPEMGVGAFSFMAKFHQNQKLLMQAPEPVPGDTPLDVSGARMIIEGVMAEGRKTLTAQESKSVLAAFHIPVNPTITVRSAQEALIAAESLGYPVVLKVNMAEFSHKSDIGGVRLNIVMAQSVRENFLELEESVKAQNPEIEEVTMTVEPMYRSAHARELLVGVVRDPVFGPAISVGMGGTMVEILQDKAVGLPPLNRSVANRMLSRTKAGKLIKAFRNMPAVNEEALMHTLMRISDLVSHLPEVLELDINPLIVDEHGVMAVDGRIKVGRSKNLMPYEHMAIHPYPSELEESWHLPSGMNVIVRPIKPEDANIEQDFVRNLSEQSRFFRFMRVMQELTPEMLARFTQIDYDREMAFIALSDGPTGTTELGVCRYVTNPDWDSAEFALVVADAYQGKGIGTKLMQALMTTAKNRGLKMLEGEVLTQNRPMRGLMSKLGFVEEPVPDDDEIVHVYKRL